MPLSTTRRTTAVRTLAGTALTAALLVPAATACSSTSDAPKSTTSAAAPATTTPATTPATPDAHDTTAPAATPSAHNTAAPTTTPGTHTTTKPTATTKPAATPHTQTLVDGSTTEIRDLGAQRFQAKIVNHGQVLATLETNGTDTGLDANDMFVVLSMDGTVHSWMGGGHQGPGTFKLAGGWTAKVTKVGDLRYRAEIIGHDDEVDGTLEADQHDAGGVANGVYLVLTAGGEISAHM
ncbi:hypothetical protein ABZW30_35365 [Kitasatospora sp. NPDC004669]|uniref:hypothetical protein n=1 Tax=Kitasatospora sp. NPDC004669 TaxID=3154555 RepID=UPI0033BAD224